MIPNFDGIYNDTQSVAVNAESVVGINNASYDIIFIAQCHFITIFMKMIMNCMKLDIHFLKINK